MTRRLASGKVRNAISDFPSRLPTLRLILGALAFAIFVTLIVRDRLPRSSADPTPMRVVSAPGDARFARGGVSYAAPKRSVLDVPPSEMRDVVRDLRRVSADRRVLLAIADIHHTVTGAPRTPVHISWENDRWRLRYGHELTDVGVLSELANLAESRALLTEWARSLARDTPFATPIATPHPLASRARPALDSLTAPSAIRTLALVDEAWRASRDVRLLPIAAEALAILAVVCEDRVDLADVLYARALATSALARAAGMTPNRQLDAMLANALGYRADAVDSAASLGHDDPVLLFLTKRDSALTRSAAADSDALTRFMAISRAATRSRSAWESALQGLGRWPGRSTTSFKSALTAEEFNLERTIPVRVPAAVLTELDEIRKPDGLAARVVGGALRWVRRVQPAGMPGTGSLGSTDEVQQLESRLATVGAQLDGPFVDASVVDAFYRAFYFSAVHGAAVFALERYSSADDAADIANRMKGDVPSSVSSELATWLDHLVAAKRGRTNKQHLTSDITDSRWLGHRQLDLTMAELSRGTIFAAQSWLHRIARQYAARLDARPSHVRALATLAHTTTWDAPAADTYYRAVIDREGSMDSRLAPWVARFLRDTTRLLQMIDDSSLTQSQRVEAARLASLDSIVPASYLRPRFERLVALDPSSWNTRESYIAFLRANGDHSAIERTTRDWLGSWVRAGSAFDETSARVELSRALVDQNRVDDAWTAIEPAISSAMGSAFRQGVAVLARLGRLDEARALAEQFIERYPDAGAAHVALADVLWRQNDYHAAARALHTGLRWIDSWTFRREIARSFVDVMGNRSTSDVARAVDALAGARVESWQIGQLGIGLRELKRPDLAYAVHSMASERTGAGGFFMPMQTFTSLRAWKGDSEAVDWLRPYAALGTDGSVAMILYQDRLFEELWSIDRPPVRTSFPWLLRAAAAATSSSIARRHGDALRAHFRQTSTDPYHTMGRYVMGLASETEMLAVATTPDRRCEVAYYMGVRALADGRPYDAADWFLVVTASGQWNEGESIWALQQLASWSNGPHNLAGWYARRNR